MEWLVENAALVANLASLATLVVWTIYLVLFYREFRRQRTPFLIIHQAHGHGLEATALVVNLSKEPVHVLCAMLVLRTARGTFVQQLHDFRRLVRDAGSRDAQTAIKQGPLVSGAFLGLGSFETMLNAATREVLRHSEGRDRPDEDLDLSELLRELHGVEIRVVALHAAHSRPIGASRTFHVHREGARVAIEPAVLLTRQWTSRSRRRVVRQWLQDCLPRPVPDAWRE